MAVILSVELSALHGQTHSDSQSTVLKFIQLRERNKWGEACILAMARIRLLYYRFAVKPIRILLGQIEGHRAGLGF